MEDEIYMLQLEQRILFLGKGIVLVLALSYLFYESLWAALPMCPMIYGVYHQQKKKWMDQQKWKLNQEFKDALEGITAALSVGYSIENAVTEALSDLRCVYKENDLIVKEFCRMSEKIKLNATVENVFFDFGKRSNIEDITNFAWILYTAKRTGGNLLQITRNTSNIISERIEVNREIQTVITGKRLESNIMSLVPAGIIVYLKFGCQGFLDPLYRNAAGIFVMSIVLFFYILAYLLSIRLVKIQV